MNIIDQRIAREVKVIDASIIETGSVILALYFGREPVVGAMDKGIVEGFAFSAKEIEGEVEAVHWLVKWDNRVLRLVSVSIKQYCPDRFLVVEIVAGQVEVLT